MKESIVGLVKALKTHPNRLNLEQESLVWVFFWSGTALIFLIFFIITNFKQFKKK